MYREITKIRVSNSNINTTENIYRVKLTNEEEQPISVVIARIGAGVNYYYRDTNSNVINIELTYPIYKEPFLRSVNFDGVYDHLLDLPHF